jgi:2-dehydropantoate 2-reductase
MRYIIYGAGAVGSVIGGRLYRVGCEVILIGRGAHLKSIQDQGLVMRTSVENLNLPIPAVGHPSEISFSKEDVVFFTMKSQDSEEAHRTLFALTGGDLPVVCAQNGVNNERLALRRFRKVYGLIVGPPSSYIEPGIVIDEAAPDAGVMDLGLYPQGVDDLAKQIAHDLEASGYISQADPDIMRWKYTKLVLNLDNVASAIFQPGEPTEEIVRKMREEALACLQAAAIRSVPVEEMLESPRKYFKSVEVEGSPRKGSSTWQSLARSRPTVETDYLNGEIVMLGALHNVPTPYNRTAQVLANKTASGRYPPRGLTIDDFMQTVES